MKMTYEQAEKRLEEIVSILEEGSIPLEESMKLYEEGIKLSEFCMQQLKNAKQKIVDINEVKNNGWYKYLYKRTSWFNFK